MISNRQVNLNDAQNRDYLQNYANGVCSLFLLGILCSQSISIPPNQNNIVAHNIGGDGTGPREIPQSATTYREEKSTYSKQTVNDSAFNLAPSASLWNTTFEGDNSDVDAKIAGNQANSTIIGDQRNFTLAGVPQTGRWTAMHIPSYVSSLYPQWSGTGFVWA